MKIVLYSDDINLITYWERACNGKCTTLYDLQDLLIVKNSIVIVNYSAIYENSEKIIKTVSENLNLVMVLHRTPNLQNAKEVIASGARAYGNALMKEHFILSAIDAMKDSLVWLHPEFTSELISKIPETENRDVSWVLDKLSDREKEVALLLKNGKTYKSIAEELSITPRTVKAHAQSIYKKLYVKDRVALALLLK